MKQIVLAIHNCQSAHKKIPQAGGYFPGTGHISTSTTSCRAAAADLKLTAPAQYSSVFYFLLPFMEETAKSMQFPEGSTQDVQFNAKAAGSPGFLCPSDVADDNHDGILILSATSVLGVADYVANMQALGHACNGTTVPNSHRKISASFPDGTSKTILFGERYAYCPDGGRNAWLGTWQTLFYDPVFAIDTGTGIQLPQDAPSLTVGASNSCNSDRIQCAHVSTMNIGMADGSVRGMNVNLSLTTWRSIILPKDASIPGDDW